MKKWMIIVIACMLLLVIVAMDVVNYYNEVCNNNVIYKGVNSVADTNNKLCGNDFMVVNEGEETLEISLYKIEVNDGVATSEKLNHTLSLQPGEMYPLNNDNANQYKFNESSLSKYEVGSEAYNQELSKIEISKRVVKNPDSSNIVQID